MTALDMSNHGLTLPQPEIADDYAMQRHAIEPWVPAKFDRALSLHLDQLLVCEEFFRGEPVGNGREEGRPC
jgi:hypothetical protein